MSQRPKKKYTKKCKHCREPFTPFRTTMEKYCGKSECMRVFIAEAKDKKWKKDKAKMKEDLMSTSDWLQKLQREYFNPYIRLRDHSLPCISCGIRTGQFHAGHYRSVGHNPSLRFNEDNVHKQCAQCNNYKRGNVSEYRLNLIKKIGIKRVEALEQNNHEPIKLTVSEIKGLITVYKLKIKNCKDRLDL